MVGVPEPVPLELILADGSIHPQKGTLAFADRQVDSRTGTITVVALFLTRETSFGLGNLPGSGR